MNPDAVRYRILDLPAHERPRERLMAYGPRNLSNSELLAIIVKSGSRGFSALEIGKMLIAKYGSLERIAGLNVKELSGVKGIGPAKAAEVLAALELGKRVASLKDSPRLTVKTPEDLANAVMKELSSLKKETFKVALLNVKNELIKWCHVSEGTLSASPAHPREIFKQAIYEAAAAVILVHNHPSGDPAPSREDIEVTRALRKAGNVVGIETLDHIIIGGGRFVSLRQLGHFNDLS